MKNYSNHSFEVNGRRSYLDDLFWNYTFGLVTLESLIVIISLVIISTSSLVIYRITKGHKNSKQYKNRSAFGFISLSVCDITVGLFSLPLLGISFFDITKGAPIMSSVFWFFINIPFMYSSLITAVIAVDRMLLIRLAQKYENIVTLKTLKVIIIIVLLCCLTLGFVLEWIWLNRLLRPSSYFYLRITYAILLAVPPLVIIPAHLYLLNFVLRRRGLTHLRIHHHKNSNSKRLTKTIICICSSQLILVFPYSSYTLFLILIDQTAVSFDLALHVNTFLCLHLLRYCQCFSNAIIILLNQKKQKISKPTDKEPPLRNDKSRMETRLRTWKDLRVIGKTGITCEIYSYN